MKVNVLSVSIVAAALIHRGSHHTTGARGCVGLKVMKRSHLAGALVGASLFQLALSCAHGADPTIVAAPPSAPAQLAAPRLPTLPIPETQQQARHALEIAFAAEDVGDFELAAAQLKAVLGTDFLTDTGRMNVYWHAALAYRQLGNAKGEMDTLEGFWLSAQLVPLTEDERARTQEAELKLKSLKDGPPTYARAWGGDQLVSR